MILPDDEIEELEKRIGRDGVQTICEILGEVDWDYRPFGLLSNVVLSYDDFREHVDNSRRNEKATRKANKELQKAIKLVRENLSPMSQLFPDIRPERHYQDVYIEELLRLYKKGEIDLFDLRDEIFSQMLDRMEPGQCGKLYYGNPARDMFWHALLGWWCIQTRQGITDIAISDNGAVVRFVEAISRVVVGENETPDVESLAKKLRTLRHNQTPW